MPSGKKRRATTHATSGRRSIIVAAVFGTLSALTGVWLMLPTDTIARRGKPGARPKTPIGVWFEEVSGPSGISFRHISGRGSRLYMPEIMVGGVALFDFDNDGLLDAYFVQSGFLVEKGERRPSNKMYRNQGSAVFEDVTASSGTGDLGYGMGCACGDFDNDGFTDLYVTNVGPNVLYRNNGDATFTDVTAAAGVGDASLSASAAFLDYDRDGDLDLFVTNYFAWSVETEIECETNNGLPDYCKPTNYHVPSRDTLYRNNGDGTFSDVTESAGLGVMFGNGLGVVCGDFNQDGWVDICVANDETANQLWINQGDGTFRDTGPASGLAFSGNGATEAGMGIDATDVDFDLDTDIVMTHLAGQTNTLYIRQDEYWEDRTARFGLVASRPFTGFGTALIDFNNDGLVDHYVANGRVVVGQGRYATDDPYAEPNLLFKGRQEGGFEPVEPMGGTARLLVHSSRGAAFGDIDNDGGVDILVANHDAGPYVLLNRIAVEGNWIVFDVRNRHGSPALGAKIRIHIDRKPHVKEARAAYSYCSSNDPRVHFGLGEISIVTDVRVTWPDGTEQLFGDFAAGAIHEIRQE